MSTRLPPLGLAPLHASPPILAPASGLQGYLVALAATAAAVLIRQLLTHWLGDSVPFVTLFGAVAVAVWMGGTGPGLLAAVLGFASAVWLLRPEWLLDAWTAERWLIALSYGVSCGLIVMFGHSLRRTRSALLHEVQERRAAQQQVAEQRERLRATLQSLADGVVVVDERQCVVSLNPAAERLTGWREADAVGVPAADLLALLDERRGTPAPQVLRAALATGPASAADGGAVAPPSDPNGEPGVDAATPPLVLRRRDGSQVPIDHRAAAIVDADHRRLGTVLTFRDATAQRQASRRQSEAHEALLTVVQASPLAVVVLESSPARVRLWNGAAERLFGWSGAEVLGQPPRFMPPEFQAFGDENTRRLQAGQSLHDLEVQALHADGRRVDVRLSAAPLMDRETQRVTGHLLMFADITDRKRAEASLAEADATLRAFFDNAPVGMGVVELTADGDLLHLQDNPLACLAFGVAPGGTSGRRAGSLGTSPARIAQWRSHHAESRALSRPVQFEYSERLGGQDHRYRATVCPVTPAGAAAGQAPDRYCYLTEDISERHAAETRLRESEAQARLALQIARLGTWRWDVAADRVLLDVRAREIAGFESAAAVTLADFIDRVHPDDARRVDAALRTAVAPGGDGTFSEECRVVQPGGIVRWVIARGLALIDEAPAEDPASRHAVRLLGSMLDITDRKLGEQQLADADRRKDEFLATLAHELRNPLAPLRNGVHLLKMLAPQLPTIDRPLTIMERQLGHMVRLIDDLLDVARVSGGQLRLQRHRMDIADVVRDAVETSQTLIDAAGHRLELRLPAHPLEVDGDPTRLCQVLANLLNNAAKYTPSGGELALSVEPTGPGDSEVRLRVADNGRGIAADMLPRVFDMFTRIDGDDGARSGLGIGLAIARRLVAMHGGRLVVASEGLGRGSRFDVILPRAKAPGRDDGAAAAADAARAAAAERQRPCRILVADDNIDLAESLGNLLRLMGNDSRVAHDGRAAYLTAELFQPDIALLDIGMPVWDGFELARQLRATEWGRRIRLVAITGWGQDEDRRRSHDAGFDLHLVKPVDPAQLEALVDDVNRQRRDGTARRDASAN